LCGPARRIGADRNRLRLAGARALYHQLAAECRHERRARGNRRYRCGLCRHQSPVRSSLPDARSEDTQPMSNVETLPRPYSREWLLSDRPASRRQARLGRAYVIWRRFSENRLAVLGLAIIVALLFVAAFADVLAPHNPLQGDLRNARLLPPGADGYILGTDGQGRDILSRLIHGSRLTLFVVVLVAIIAAPVGLIVGTVSGYAGGWVDAVLMRITDIFLAFPKLVLALALVAALGPGIENAI